MSKITIELVHKVNLLQDITCLIFQSQDSFKFEPGQFLTIEVSPGVHRSYSLFYCDSKAPRYYENGLKDLSTDKYIGLMINTKPDGAGSHWAQNIKVNQKFSAIGCNGSFVIHQSNKPKVFVATSTGIAPFVPMIESLLKQNPKEAIVIFFGALTIQDNFSEQFLGGFESIYPDFKIYCCYDILEVNKQNSKQKSGRVTQIIPESMTNDQMQNSDFYLCGNPMMVEAANTLLVKNKVENIYFEKY